MFVLLLLILLARHLLIMMIMPTVSLAADIALERLLACVNGDVAVQRALLAKLNMRQREKKIHNDTKRDAHKSKRGTQSSWMMGTMSVAVLLVMNSIDLFTCLPLNIAIYQVTRTIDSILCLLCVCQLDFGLQQLKETHREKETSDPRNEPSGRQDELTRFAQM